MKCTQEIFQEKSEAQAKVSELEQALASNDLELIRTKKDELEKVVQALATKVYQQAQQAQQQAQQQGQSNGSRPDDVVDVPFGYSTTQMSQAGIDNAKQ